MNLTEKSRDWADEIFPGISPANVAGIFTGHSEMCNALVSMKRAFAKSLEKFGIEVIEALQRGEEIVWNPEGFQPLPPVEKETRCEHGG